MLLTDYLSLDEVRQAIGVDQDELSDDSLLMPMYMTELTLALATVSDGGLQAVFNTIAAKSTMTAQEKQLFDLTRLYAVYSTAIACLPGLPLAIMKDETDGQADFGRFGGNVHDQVMQRLTSAVERVSIPLTTVYMAIASITTARPVLNLLGISGPTYDPITG
jgi:hypothetical protein